MTKLSLLPIVHHVVYRRQCSLQILSCSEHEVSLTTGGVEDVSFRIQKIFLLRHNLISHPCLSHIPVVVKVLIIPHTKTNFSLLQSSSFSWRGHVDSVLLNDLIHFIFNVIRNINSTVHFDSRIIFNELLSPLHLLFNILDDIICTLRRLFMDVEFCIF